MIRKPSFPWHQSQTRHLSHGVSAAGQAGPSGPALQLIDHHSYFELAVSDEGRILAASEMHVFSAVKWTMPLGEVRMVLHTTRASGSAVGRAGRGLHNSTTALNTDVGRWNGQLFASMRAWVPKMETKRSAIACHPNGRRGWARSWPDHSLDICIFDRSLSHAINAQVFMHKVGSPRGLSKSPITTADPRVATVDKSPATTPAPAALREHCCCKPRITACAILHSKSS
ncbi:hypothetical protein F5883DRAFT_210412 [Diaporthe sp. PMI_573]|jgi:hypothetical protein|nr:hypothetical protein F5883DRAFT_210412 [Diaporthaceae sp. PMI_573]